jgi:hypothetical protein
MTATITFPTRICRDTATLIDNIFVNGSSCYTIEPCSNGLSDHEGLILTLETFSLLYNDNKYIQTRVFHDKAIQDFQLQLRYEFWENVFGNNCVNDSFNNFLNTYLRCYYTNFTKQTAKKKRKFQNWLTTVIKTSCKRKRELTILCRYSNDHNLKLYYKRYCRILSKVIILAKKIILQ